MFFVLGLVAARLRSDLEFPAPIPKLLALYLLTAIGVRGGVELAHSGVTASIALTLTAAVLMATLVPFWTFFLLRRPLGVNNAAAVAAAYGSVSAVTFVTAADYLERTAVPFGGHMVAALALMESPAIIVGVLLARVYAAKESARGEHADTTEAGPRKLPWSRLWHDAFCNGSVVLLLGSFFIGIAIGDEGGAKLAPFTTAIFPGVLCMFLADMGLLAGRRWSDLGRVGPSAVAAGTILPILHAGLGLVVARLLGMSEGDALLFVVLCASASYIAVPAAVRLAIPKANPSIYVTMSLAVTFPLNVVVGIPLYLEVIRRFWAG